MEATCLSFNFKCYINSCFKKLTLRTDDSNSVTKFKVYLIMAEQMSQIGTSKINFLLYQEEIHTCNTCNQIKLMLYSNNIRSMRIVSCVPFEVYSWVQVISLSTQGSEASFEWSDGSAFDYIPWKGEKGPGDCVVLDPKGNWKHEKCSSSMDGAICYKSTKCKLSFPINVFTKIRYNRCTGLILTKIFIRV